MSSITKFRDFEFFRELKIMSDIGFHYYKVPDPMDNVCDLANEMLFTSDISSIIRDVYPDTCVEEIDVSWINKFLSKISLENAKMILSGKDLLHKKPFDENH